MPSASTSSTSASAAPKPQFSWHDLLLDQHRDHDVALPAQQRRGDVEPERQNEHQETPRGDPRQAERKENAPEDRRGPRPQVPRGAQQVAVDAAHDRVERQDHEWQQDMNHPDVDREAGIEQLHRFVAHARGDQRLVDDPLLSQQHHPGVGADQDARPERDQHQDHQQIGARGEIDESAYATGYPSSSVQKRHDDGDLQRDAEHPDVGVHRQRCAKDVDRAARLVSGSKFCHPQVGSLNERSSMAATG